MVLLHVDKCGDVDHSLFNQIALGIFSFSVLFLHLKTWRAQRVKRKLAEALEQDITPWQTKDDIEDVVPDIDRPNNGEPLGRRSFANSVEISVEKEIGHVTSPPLSSSSASSSSSPSPSSPLPTKAPSSTSLSLSQATNQAYLTYGAASKLDSIDDNSSFLFPFHISLLYLASFLLLVRTALQTFEDPHSRSFGLFTVVFVNPLGTAVSESVGVFLCFKGIGYREIKVTFFFGVFWFVCHSVFGYVMWNSNTATGTSANFVKTSTTFYWVVYDGSRVLLYSLALLFSLSRWRGRWANLFYSLFNFVIFSLTTIGNVLLALSMSASECYLFSLWTIWTVTWPVVTYLCFYVDSKYWRRQLLSGVVGSESFNEDERERERERDGTRVSNEGRKSVGERDNNTSLSAYLSHSRGVTGPAFSSLGSDTPFLTSGPSDQPLLSPLSHSPSALEVSFYPKHFVLSLSDLSFSQKIGVGGTSHVFLGLLRLHSLSQKKRLWSLISTTSSSRTQNGVTQIRVAIKRFFASTLTPEYSKRFAREMYLCSTLEGPRIVRSIGVCINPPNMCLISEFMENGSLFQVIGRARKGLISLSFKHRLSFAIDIAEGVLFLHSQSPPVIHRDIKSLNLLVNAEWEVKLADLGEARYLPERVGESHLTTERGTPQWMAPELFLGRHYDESVDIYALGVVLWELASLDRPFTGVSQWLIPGAVCDRDLRPALSSLQEDVPIGYSELIQACWVRDPRSRPTAVEVLERLREVRLDLLQTALTTTSSAAVHRKRSF